MFFKQWQGHIVWSVVGSEKEAKTLSSIRILVANRKASCRVTTTGEDQNHLGRVSPSGNSGTVIGAKWKQTDFIVKNNFVAN